MIAGTEAYSIPSTVAVVILATPAATFRRVWRWSQIYNPVGNGSIDVVLRYNNGSITSRICKLTIAEDSQVVISGREEDVANTPVDKVVHIELDDSSARVVEAVLGSNPTTPLEVISSWGDYQ
jgi:hypothetical protein